MKRRELIALFGGAAVAWSLPAHPQTPAKTIGLLFPGPGSSLDPWFTAFVQRLHQLGWIDGRNIAIEYRWGQGRGQLYSDIAVELINLKVNVIVTAGYEAVVAVKHATSIIPIVVAGVGDPVGYNLVASLARPGGNITGLSTQSSDIAPKRVELIREVVPTLHRLAIIGNPSNSILDMGEVQLAAKTLGLEVLTFEIRRTEDIAPVFETLKDRADAIYVATSPGVITPNRALINGLALGARLPTMHGHRGHVQAGGLMSYGPDLVETFRRAAEYVDKILRGERPGDIPIEQPTKFELVINLKTAKALGITIPPTLLARADEVIE
jgi:ABC-type uncharacterized transport system substrate-binding protein